ncbi:MAG: hypothetical protein WC510_07725 [Candidatus Omnitrophota bacterium]
MKKKYASQAIRITIITSALFLFSSANAGAKEEGRVNALAGQIIEAKSEAGLLSYFEELKELYTREGKFTDFLGALKALSGKNKAIALGPFIDYYSAYARYSQLKYLEETQGWDEYFSKGNDYRTQIVEYAQKAIDETTVKDALNIYARLLIWRFHKDQEDVFSEEALTDLMSAITEYARESKDMGAIKDIADALLSYNEKAKARQLYGIYVQGVVSSGLKEEKIKEIAYEFYQKGNLELAESLYDVYIEMAMKSYPKEKLLTELLDIGSLFSSLSSGPNDPVYAEKIFKKIEEIAGKDSFTEELIYLRAFNLEKMKAYQEAKDLYAELTVRYPEGTHADEANFKTGMILIYTLGDIKTGREYFEKLSQKEHASPQVISSIYQLGLLSQWQEKYEAAKEYYNKLLLRVGEDFPETAALAKKRLNEIDSGKPMEYSLKTFMDLSLKNETQLLEANRVELNTSPYIVKKDQGVLISSVPYGIESGCVQVEMQYLWSGHIGTAEPSPEQASFNTTYNQRGTKEINLVVVSPTGVIDRNIDMADVR